MSRVTKGLPKGVKISAKPALELAFRRLFRELGVPEQEWEDRGLDIRNTPGRVARMYRDELLSSYRPGAHEDLIRKFTCFDEKGDDAMVVEGPISFHSLCAHHCLPFSGEAYVGYIPDQKIVGASKLARVVTHYSHMLQIQERMGRQVAEFILEHAQPKAVLVTITAAHYCMRCRGVKQENTRLVTTTIRPLPVATERRDIVEEFYQLSGIARG
jgi:GTP cyclohydrolase I